MSPLAALALKTALSNLFAPAVQVPGVGAVPFRFDRERFGGAKTYARAGTVIETRSVTGSECVAQIDVFTFDATGANAYRAGDVITRAITAPGALAITEGFAFPYVRADPSFDTREEGPDNSEVTHLVLQFRVRCQALAFAPGRF